MSRDFCAGLGEALGRQQWLGRGEAAHGVLS
jgi:hypothetical protein